MFVIFKRHLFYVTFWKDFDPFAVRVGVGTFVLLPSQTCIVETDLWHLKTFPFLTFHSSVKWRKCSWALVSYQILQDMCIIGLLQLIGICVKKKDIAHKPIPSSLFSNLCCLLRQNSSRQTRNCTLYVRSFISVVYILFKCVRRWIVNAWTLGSTRIYSRIADTNHCVHDV